MRTVIIACKTLEKELCAAMNQLNCNYPIVWLESGLHNIPRTLNAALQTAIHNCQEYDTILLAMGFCGNALQGITSPTARLILPRADDCITLLLGSIGRRTELSGSYFFTEGWLQGERTVWWEYQQAEKKYGSKRANRIFQSMLRNYHQILMIDTGCFDLIPAYAEVERMSKCFSLKSGVVSGSIDWLTHLLTGPWPENKFLCIPPGDTIHPSHLHL